MTYKLLIIKNRYSGKLNVQKYLDWFALYTPIKIQIETIETNFDVTTQEVSNATFKGVICGKDILDKVRKIVPEGKYNCIAFVYGNDLNGIRVSSTNITGQDPIYPDTEFIQTFRGDDGGKVINHELFHAFFFKAKKCGENIYDNMDTYLHDSDLSVDKFIDTNREVAIMTLAPHWDKICNFRNMSAPQPVPTYKYFKPSEIIGLKPELVALLDKARDLAGVPF